MVLVSDQHYRDSISSGRSEKLCHQQEKSRVKAITGALTVATLCISIRTLTLCRRALAVATGNLKKYRQTCWSYSAGDDNSTSKAKGTHFNVIPFLKAYITEINW